MHPNLFLSFLVVSPSYTIYMGIDKHESKYQKFLYMFVLLWNT